MIDIKLITNEDLTRNSPLGGNIDVDKYGFVINETQVFVIEVILGTKLYNKILSDYKDLSVEGIYKTLLENYIQPIIIYSVSAEYILLAPYIVGNAGIFKYSPENTEPASRGDVEELAKKQRGKADVYIERLQRFLCDKANEIPEYETQQDNSFDVKPDSDVDTYGGWRLSGRNYSGTNAEREIWRDILHDEGR